MGHDQARKGQGREEEAAARGEAELLRTDDVQQSFHETMDLYVIEMGELAS